MSQRSRYPHSVFHAYELTSAGVVSRFGLLAAADFATAYLIMAVLFFGVAQFAKR